MSIRKTEVKVTLSRDLSVFDITMIGVGAMIGAGIFVLTGHAAGAAGLAFLVAFLLNGMVTLFTAASYAKLGSAYPEAGGGYLWIKEGMIRLGRDEVKGIFRTARQRWASLMVLDWRGYTRSRGRRFGHVIDRLVDNPPCDVAVVSHKGLNGVKRILVPASGGPHAVLAASLAAQLGVHFDASATMLNICTREFTFTYQVLSAADAVEGILAQAVDYDLVLVSAVRLVLLIGSFSATSPSDWLPNVPRR